MLGDRKLHLSSKVEEGAIASVALVLLALASHCLRLRGSHTRPQIHPQGSHASDSAKNDSGSGSFPSSKKLRAQQAGTATGLSEAHVSGPICLLITVLTMQMALQLLPTKEPQEFVEQCKSKVIYLSTCLL